jgi:hypothetical protein
MDPVKEYVLPALLDEVVELLGEVRDCLDNYSDAQEIDGRTHCNQAMTLTNACDEMLVKLALVGAK